MVHSVLPVGRILVTHQRQPKRIRASISMSWTICCGRRMTVAGSHGRDMDDGDEHEYIMQQSIVMTIGHAQTHAWVCSVWQRARAVEIASPLSFYPSDLAGGLAKSDNDEDEDECRQDPRPRTMVSSACDDRTTKIWTGLGQSSICAAVGSGRDVFRIQDLL